MTITVCLAHTMNRTARATGNGGLEWMGLNWALGLRALGCRVIWIETIKPGVEPNRVRAALRAFREHLSHYGFEERIAVRPDGSKIAEQPEGDGWLRLDDVDRADLLISLGHYFLGPAIVDRFQRSALIDTDPGGTQIWIAEDRLNLPDYDLYFSYGETVGRRDAPFPNCGLKWLYTPPCVSLDWWPVSKTPGAASFTTVSGWFGDWMSWRGDRYPNDKRAGFLPYLGLPSMTAEPLELALDLWDDKEGERQKLEHAGWNVRNTADVAATPWTYQQYIQKSRGEFSCAKPHYIHLQTAWISERTLNYLASGRPAVVAHTGPSEFLPDAAGLFRFRDVEEAACCLRTVADDYAFHCQQARALAAEYFDAKKVTARLLERAL